MGGLKMQGPLYRNVTQKQHSSTSQLRAGYNSPRGGPKSDVPLQWRNKIIAIVALMGQPCILFAQEFVTSKLCNNNITSVIIAEVLLVIITVPLQ